MDTGASKLSGSGDYDIHPVRKRTDSIEDFSTEFPVSMFPRPLHASFQKALFGTNSTILEVDENSQQSC